METNNEVMKSEDSLKIITDMIHKTRLNIKQSIFHLLFWGWLILVCSLSDFILSNFTGFAHPYLSWLLTIPGAFVSMIYGYRNGKKQSIHTYADKINMWTWIAFLVTIIILFVFMWDNLGKVGPFILLLAGYPTFLSGIIIRFKPLLFGGISFWILAIIGYFTEPMISQAVVPLAVIAGYLIPGYLLRKVKTQ